MQLASAELARLGPPQAESYVTSAPGDESFKPSAAERLQEALPELLGADELKDENDILTIANAALMAGHRDPADLISWLARQETLAKMSKLWIEDSKYQRPPPRVTQLARYLRYSQEQNKRFGR